MTKYSRTSRKSKPSHARPQSDAQSRSVAKTTPDADHRVELPEIFQRLMRWEDLVLVAPKTLTDNPHNWKTHPNSQMDGVLALAKNLGWVLPLLFNLTTGRLLDGHGRKSKAIKDGVPYVPVARGRWSEEEELILLQGIDSVGSMYKIHGEKLRSLTKFNAKSVKALTVLGKESRKTLDGLLSRTGSFLDALESDEIEATPLPLHSFPLQKIDREERALEPPTLDEYLDEQAPETTTTLAIDDVFFPPDAWGLPVLEPSLLADESCVPDAVYDRTPESVTSTSYYCQSARPFHGRYEEDREDRRAEDPNDDTRPLHVPGGLLGCFTEDARFAAYYDNPALTTESLLEEKWSALCCPDFSTFEDWPFPMRLWALYRSRWVARYWQSFGMKIVPILQNVSFRTPDGTAVNIATSSLLDTLGEGIPVVAVQCRTLKHHGGRFEDFGKWLSLQIDMLKPRVVIIYGGEEHQGKFFGFIPRASRKLRYVMLPSYMEKRRRLIKAGRSNKNHKTRKRSVNGET